MKGIPGTLQGGGAPFLTTHWSVVQRSAQHGHSPDVARAALTQLCQDYWPPLYTFVRRRGYAPSDAQDLVQGFFVHLLRSNACAAADRTRGKFRTFLLSSLKHFLADAHDHAVRLKRGGGGQLLPLDETLAQAEAGAVALPHEPAAQAETHEDQLFEQRWAAALVRRALERLGEGYAAEGKLPVFETLRPFIAGGSVLPPKHEQAAARLGVPDATLRSHLRRLRTRYRDALRAEIARTVARAAEIDEELRHLCDVLLKAGGNCGV